MTWRTAHGAARDCGRLLVSETKPSDELRPASNPDPDRADRSPDGKFLPGNRYARLAKVRAGPTGVLAALEAKADPAWQAARRWARRATGFRVAELTRAHGELSSGVCRLVKSECSLDADAEYLSARAAADNNPDLLRVAAQLRAGSRQAARDAWELATREADERRKRNPTAELDALLRRKDPSQ